MNRLMLLGFLLATATAQSSGTLQLGKPTVEQDRITVPVMIGGDLSGGVSAMDFRFRYNPEALQPVSVVAGTAAQTADKRVMSNQRTPGEYAVVMMGFNQSSCGPGEAIRIVFQRLQGADRKWDLSLSDPTMSTVDGRLIESQVLPSDIEPAGDAEPEEGTGRQPQVPDVDPGTEEADAPGVPQAAVYDGPPAEPAAEAAPETTASKTSADTLTAALESAEDARQGIESPERHGADEVEGSAEETGTRGDTRFNEAVENGGEIIYKTSLNAVGGKSPERALRNNTVELQSRADAAESPAEAGNRGVTYARVVLAVFCVFALAAVFLWRRSRLIG